jgi:hypothetical protein
MTENQRVYAAAIGYEVTGRGSGPDTAGSSCENDWGIRHPKRWSLALKCVGSDDTVFTNLGVGHRLAAAIRRSSERSTLWGD